MISKKCPLTVCNQTHESPKCLLCLSVRLWNILQHLIPYRFIYFHILQITPLHYNPILCDPTAFVWSFSWSLSSSWAVFILLPPSPHQPLAVTRGISHRFSPAWTWSQRQPHPAAYMCGSFTTWWDPKWVLLPKQGKRSVWPVPQEQCTQLSCRFLSQTNCGCRFFLQTASPPDLTFSVLPTQRDIITCQAI